MGENINSELLLHSDLLNDLDQGIDETHLNLRSGTKKAADLMKRDNSCTGMLIIIVLLLLIVVYVVRLRRSMNVLLMGIYTDFLSCDQPGACSSKITLAARSPVEWYSITWAGRYRNI